MDANSKKLNILENEIEVPDDTCGVAEKGNISSEKYSSEGSDYGDEVDEDEAEERDNNDKNVEEDEEKEPHKTTRIDWRSWKDEDVGNTNLLSDWSKGEMEVDSKNRTQNIPQDIRENPTPYGVFSLFFQDQTWKLLVDQTNEYYNQQIKELERLKLLKPKSRYYQWKPTTIEEMKAFHGIILWMGIISTPDMADNWSQNPLFHTNFEKHMSYFRFSLLLRFFHINNNKDDDDKEDLLFKVRPIISILNDLFEKLYQAGKHLCIDECMIKFNGRVKFKQYIMRKPVKYGVKGFLLCDSNNYYCYKIEIYTANQSQQKISQTYTSTEQTVIRMTQNYINQNRIIYMDNFYTSLKLADYFTSNKTGMIGTIRTNRLLSKTKLEEPKSKGDCKFYINEKKDKILTFYHDRTQVKFLSTSEPPALIEMKKTRAGVSNKEFLPNYVIDYNLHSKGVDFCNERSTSYRFPHGSTKWWRPVYMHLFQLAMSNAYIIYSELAQMKPSYKIFYTSIVDSLLGKEKYQKKKKLHLPEYIEETISLGKKQRRRLRCKFPGCKSDTSWYCPDCTDGAKKLTFCLPVCYNKYHRTLQKNKY